MQMYKYEPKQINPEHYTRKTLVI